MSNIHELTTDHKIKLKKPMGCFDNLGEVCEIVKIDTDENVINFRFGVDGVHLGVMSGDELEKYFDVIEPAVAPDDYEWHPYGFIDGYQVMYHALKNGSISMETTYDGDGTISVVYEHPENPYRQIKNGQRGRFYCEDLKVAFFKLKKTYYDKLYEDIQEEVMLDFVKNKDKLEPVEVNEQQDAMIDNVKLTIRIFSIAVCVLLYVAAWVWFIITARDDSDNWDSPVHAVFLFWIILHVVFLIELILWVWCQKEVIKMGDFKVGDEVYFAWYGEPYTVKSGIITEIKCLGDLTYIMIQDSITHGLYMVLLEEIYRTESEIKAVLKREFYAKVNEVKKDIHTLEELLKFMYNNDLTIDEDDGYCVCEERVAVRELAKEICGIELGE